MLSWGKYLVLGFALLLPVAATPQAAVETVDFSLPDIAGNNLRLSDYRGSWVVINFWATWCGPCLQEIPELIEFHRQHHQRDAVVIGVNFETIDVDLLSAFVREQGIIYPVVRIGSEPLRPFEPLKGLPSTFVVNPAGVYVASHVGPITAKLIEEFMAREDGFAASE